jgi:cytochrome c-type biogenesis protein CcmH/NrfG
MKSRKPAQPPKKSDTVAKSTFYGGIMVALSIGFLIGVVFSAFKGAGPGAPTPPAGNPMAKKQARPTVIPDSLKQQIAAAEKEVLSKPNDAGAWKQLGNGYFDAGQYQQAIEAYTKSLEIDPANADVWTDMGVMYRRAGNPQKAIESFEKAVAANPAHEVSRFNKGIVLMHDLDDPQAALEAWEELVQVNPFASAPNGQPLKSLIEQLKKTAAK